MKKNCTASLLAACAMVLSGCYINNSGDGILVDHVSASVEGSTCILDSTLCLEQSSSADAMCAGLASANARLRTITAKTIPSGLRYAVLFERVMSPAIPDAPKTQALVALFSDKQITANLGCNQEKHAQQVHYIQLKFMCAVLLEANAAEPKPEKVDCTKGLPFDPNLLPATPLPVTSLPALGLGQMKVALLNAQFASSCESICEDPYGACVRLKTTPKLLASILSPALPISGATATRTFPKKAYMAAFEMTEDPCERNDLIFEESGFRNQGKACEVAWQSPILGTVTVIMPNTVSGKTSGDNSRFKLTFPDEATAVKLKFADKDFEMLNGPISSIEATSKSLYARLPSTCASFKSSSSTIIASAESAQAVAAIKIDSRIASLRRRTYALLGSLR